MRSLMLFGLHSVDEGSVSSSSSSPAVEITREFLELKGEGDLLWLLLTLARLLDSVNDVDDAIVYECR